MSVNIANAIIRVTKQIEEAFSDHPESVPEWLRVFCKVNATNPNKLISTAFTSTARVLNQAYSSTVAGEPIESELPDSSVVEQLRKLCSRLDSAIINEEMDVALKVLEEMRGVPVTLNALKISKAVKFLRKQRKQGCGSVVIKSIDETISAWEQRTMEVAKKRIVPIKLSGKRSRDASSAHTPKPGRGKMGSSGTTVDGNSSKRVISDVSNHVTTNPSSHGASVSSSRGTLTPLDHATSAPSLSTTSDTLMSSSDIQVEDIDRCKVMDYLVRQILDSVVCSLC